MKRHAVLIAIIFLSLAAYRMQARADLVMKNAGTGAELRLLESPCVNDATLAEIKDEFAPQFKAARAIVDGRTFEGCWLEAAGRVVMFFENGERFMVPASKFRDPMV